MTIQSRAHEIATWVAKKYGEKNACDICAKEMAEELVRAGITGEIITISTGTNKGVDSRIMSKSRNEQIGNQGYHIGVLVEGKVFDNLHTNGIPVGEWMQDFESRGNMTVERKKSKLKQAMDKNSIKDLILEIKKRPSIYLTTNTIHAFASFIDGWMMRDEESLKDAEILSEYNEWAHEHYKIGATRAWYNILLFYSNDEISALKLFFETFDRFLEERELNLKNREQPKRNKVIND